MANRHISVPKLSGAARAEAAVNVATLAEAGLSDPQIGRKLGYTTDQIRRVREQYKIPPGQPIRAGRPGHKGHVHARGNCPVCGRDCAMDRFGAIGQHLQELVGSHGQRKHGDWCDGVGQQAEAPEKDRDITEGASHG